MSDKASPWFSAPILYGAGLVALALIMLAGLRIAGQDDGQPVNAMTDIATPEAVPAGRPSFARTAEDMDIWLQRTALFRADRRTDMRNPDSFTGGESFMILHDVGALNFYTVPTGRVWRIRQLSGKSHACGTTQAGVNAAIEMAEQFALVELTSVQKAEVSRALSEDTFYDAHLGIAKLGISGACVDAITLTAL